MKIQWKIILGATVFFILCGAALPFMHFKAKRAVQVYKRQLVKQGEKLTVSELISPSATNGNKLGREFLELAKPFTNEVWGLFPGPMQMLSAGRWVVTWREEDLYYEPFWQTSQKKLEANIGATASLRGATQGGELIFPVEAQQYRPAQRYRPGARGAVVNWLSTATTFQLHQGNQRQAVENLTALVRCLEKFKWEPSRWSQLDQADCVSIAFFTTWSALQFDDWNDGELEAIQKAWSKVKFESAERYFATELADCSGPFEEARKAADLDAAISGRKQSLGLVRLTDLAIEATSDSKAAINRLMKSPKEKLWRWVVSYDEELATLKQWRSGLEVSRSMDKKGFFQPGFKKLDSDLKTQPWEDEFLLGDSRPLVRQAIFRWARDLSSRQLAVSACALRRFKLQSGYYPGTLEELTPEFLADIPRDPADGEPIRYELDADGSFRLYSIGDNGIDDGGDPEPERQKENSTAKAFESRRGSMGRDWVWPQAGTKEEAIKWRDEHTTLTEKL